MTQDQIYEFFEILLEDESLEDILERYDLSPLETLMTLWKSGLIQEDYPVNEDSIYDQETE